MKRECPEVLQTMEIERQVQIERNRTYDYTPRSIPNHKQDKNKNYGLRAQQDDKTSDEIEFLR